MRVLWREKSCSFRNQWTFRRTAAVQVSICKTNISKSRYFTSTKWEDENFTTISLVLVFTAKRSFKLVLLQLRFMLLTTIFNIDFFKTVVRIRNALQLASMCSVFLKEMFYKCTYVFKTLMGFYGFFVKNFGFPI